MRLELDLPAGENQQDFLDHLSVGLRAVSGAGSGTGEFAADGTFTVRMVRAFQFGGRETLLEWTSVTSADGTLRSLQVESAKDAQELPDWHEEVQALVVRALSSALSKRKLRFVCRSEFYYIGQGLDGEYWLPGFRFAPLIPDDEHPSLLNAERVVVVDHEVDAIDGATASDIGKESANRYAARVGLLANIGLYGKRSEIRWYSGRTPETLGRSERGFAGYSGSESLFGRMPNKGDLCALGQPDSSILIVRQYFQPKLTLPKEARRILRGLNSVTPATVDAFDRCARLHQVSLVAGRDFPSVGLAYAVASVEAIAQSSVHSHFSEFVRAYVKPREGLDGILSYLYGDVRSAHFHAGKFPLGEFSRSARYEPFMVAGDVIKSNLHWTAREVLREAVVNWMTREVLDKAG